MNRSKTAHQIREDLHRLFPRLGYKIGVEIATREGKSSPTPNQLEWREGVSTDDMLPLEDALRFVPRCDVASFDAYLVDPSTAIPGVVGGDYAEWVDIWFFYGRYVGIVNPSAVTDEEYAVQLQKMMPILLPSQPKDLVAVLKRLKG